MLFNSLSFLFLFLPATLTTFCYLENKDKWRAHFAVVVASFVFYAVDSIPYAFLLFTTIITNYYLAQRIEEAERLAAKFYLICGVTGNTLLLCYFKYANFIADVLLDLSVLHTCPAKVQLPPGLSFYTFIQIAYLVDVYRGVHTARGSLLNYSFFVSFFPHLIAGPIIHIADMMPQLNTDVIRPALSTRLAVGITVFSVGLMKKVMLADPLSQTVNTVFKAVAVGDTITAATAWLATLCYTLQIYFDFSGYSDMAIGLAYLFGIRFPTNFDSPYQATSIIDFWRRWHMTLSLFLRNYIYIPLGGNRVGQVRRFINIFLTMLIADAWHGAGWTFLLWGGVHGVALVVAHGVRTLAGGRPIPMRWVWTGLTFLFVHLAWVLFRSSSVAESFVMYKSMFNFSAPMSLTVDIPKQLLPGLCIVWFFPSLRRLMGGYAPNLGTISPSTAWTWRPSVVAACILGLIFTVSVFSLQTPSEFIYFRF